MSEEDPKAAAASTADTSAADESTGTEQVVRRKTRIGIVASNKMQKTVVVAITRRYMHPVYKKYVKERTRYKAHDETNDCNVGDKVLIEETRPLSRQKRWRVKEIIERAPVV